MININSGIQGRTRTEHECNILKIPLVWYSLFEASKVLSSFEKIKYYVEFFKKKAGYFVVKVLPIVEP